MTAWETAYRVFQWRPYVFPAPSHVLDALLYQVNVHTEFGGEVGPKWPGLSTTFPTFARPASFSLAGWWGGLTGWVEGFPLVNSVLLSALRLSLGFVFSILLGSVLGLLMWRFKSLDEFLGPLFLGLQTLPSVCWVPLSILLFGLNEYGIMFVLVMGSFFAIAISLRDGLRTIPPIYRRAGHMLGARRARMYRYVLLPASLPAVSSSLRQGFSFAWRSLMGAELVFIAVERHGLGYLLNIGREFSDVAQVVAILIVMVVIGILADRLVFAKVEKRVHARFGLAAT